MMAYCGWLKDGPPCKLIGHVMGGHSRDLLSDFGADRLDPHHFNMFLLLCGARRSNLDQVVMLNT